MNIGYWFGLSCRNGHWRHRAVCGECQMDLMRYVLRHPGEAWLAMKVAGFVVKRRPDE